MNKKEIKDLLEHESNQIVAITLMDVAIKNFNEDNFYYYEYSINLFGMVFKLVQDKIISSERGKEINKELAKLINQSIYRSVNK